MPHSLGSKSLSRLEKADSILVVEPHSDDGYLSLGWHIEHLWKDKQVTLLTVFVDDKRKQEAANYAKAAGCKSLCLMVEQVNHLNKIVEEIKPLRVLSALATDEYDEIIFPLGLQHPDHLAVALSRSKHDLVYVDTPYCLKQKLGEELLRKTRGRRVESICYPGKRKWRHTPIFKSQSKFFHFNPMADYRVPEIILGPKGA